MQSSNISIAVGGSYRHVRLLVAWLPPSRVLQTATKEDLQHNQRGDTNAYWYGEPLDEADDNAHKARVAVRALGAEPCLAARHDEIIASQGVDERTSVRARRRGGDERKKAPRLAG